MAQIRTDVTGSYVLTEGEWKLFDNRIGEVLRHKTELYQLLPKKAIPFGVRTAEFYIYNDVTPANLQEGLDEAEFETATKGNATAQLYAITKGVRVLEEDLAAARLFNVDLSTDNAAIAAEVVAQELGKVLAVGSAWYNKAYADYGIKGLQNTSGVNNCTNGGLGGDDDVTAIGDIANTIAKMQSLLIEDKFYPPYVLVVSNGVWSQMFLNYNATTYETEFDIILAQIVY